MLWMPHVFKLSVCALGMSQGRQGGQLKHRAPTEVQPARTQVSHSSSIFPSLSLPGYLHLILYHSDYLSSLSFSLTQNMQAQSCVTMIAVAITLVSHESPNSQANGEDSTDLTVGIGHDTSGERLLAHASYVAGADEHTHTSAHLMLLIEPLFRFHLFLRQWRV